MIVQLHCRCGLLPSLTSGQLGTCANRKESCHPVQRVRPTAIFGRGAQGYDEPLRLWTDQPRESTTRQVEPCARGLNVNQSWYSSRLDPCVDPPTKIEPYLTVGRRNNIGRRYSFGTKANHKTTFLCVESTLYYDIQDLSTPKSSFKANVNEILRAYAEDHSITKEDLFLGMRNCFQPEAETLTALPGSDWDAERAGLRFVRQSQAPRRSIGGNRRDALCHMTRPILSQASTMQVESAQSLPTEGENDMRWDTEEDRASWLEVLEANKVRPRPTT